MQSNLKCIYVKAILKANTGLDDDSFENRREYFRIQLNFPIEAKMTISRIKGNAVNLKIR